MSADSSDASHPVRTRYSTAETYQRLLEIEVKSFLNRITALTASVDKIFDELGGLMLQTEDMLNRIETIGGSISFQRVEISELRKIQQQQASLLAQLLTQLSALEHQLGERASLPVPTIDT